MGTESQYIDCNSHCNGNTRMREGTCGGAGCAAGTACSGWTGCCAACSKSSKTPKEECNKKVQTRGVPGRGRERMHGGCKAAAWHDALLLRCAVNAHETCSGQLTDRRYGGSLVWSGDRPSALCSI